MALTSQASFSRITPQLKEEKSQPEKTGKQNIAALDGVRAVAALLVVFTHLNGLADPLWDLKNYPLLNSTWQTFGTSGVELFFSLSGFLLFIPFAKAILFQEKRPSTRKFYIRRIFRIWPAYYFTLAMVILFFDPEYLQPAYWKQLALFLTFFMDSSPHTWQQLDGPFWSLATEWQFYMLLPFIALCFSWITKHFLASPLQRLKVLLVCCGVFFLLEVSIRYFGFYCLLHPSQNILMPRSVLNVVLFFMFGVHGKFLEEFAFGMMASVCYVYAQHPEFGGTFKARLQQFSGWMCLLGILVLICAFFLLGGALAYMPWYKDMSLLHPFEEVYPWLGEPIASLGYSLCMVAIIFGSKRLRWPFETRLLHWIGLLSFGIYMWHYKFLGFFHDHILPYLPHHILSNHFLLSAAYWVLVAITVIPLCYALHIIVEKPGIQLGARLIARWFTQRLKDAAPSTDHIIKRESISTAPATTFADADYNDEEEVTEKQVAVKGKEA